MKKQAFTLIELMVVVAIIAILATLSVTSFSAAIKRTRNAGRQSDIQAVAKGLETCYDVASGKYNGLGTVGSQWVSVTTATGPFQADTTGSGTGNPCLNQDITPGIANYPYAYYAVTAFPQSFALCSKLEEVANWESVGNTLGVSGVPAVTCDSATGTCEINTDCSPAEDGSAVGECWFCAINQQ